MVTGMRCPRKDQEALAAAIDAYLRGIFHCGKFAPVFHHLGVSKTDRDMVLSVQAWPSREAAEEYWDVSISMPCEYLVVSCTDVDVLIVGRTLGVQSSSQGPNDHRFGAVQGGIKREIVMMEVFNGVFSYRIHTNGIIFLLRDSPIWIAMPSQARSSRHDAHHDPVRYSLSIIWYRGLSPCTDSEHCIVQDTSNIQSRSL